MMRTAVLSASLLILTSCATRSLPVDPIERPEPAAPDPRLCAPLEDAPAVVGSIVAPVTEEEREAVRSHLQSDAAARAWGERGWERAGIARAACPR